MQRYGLRSLPGWSLADAPSQERFRSVLRSAGEAVYPFRIPIKETLLVRGAPRSGQRFRDPIPLRETAGGLVDGPVAAKHDAGRPKGICGLAGVPQDLLGLPLLPVRFGDQSGYLASDVGQSSQRTDLRQPGLLGCATDVGL